MKGINKINTQLFNKIAGTLLLTIGVLFIVGSAVEWKWLIHKDGSPALNGSIPATGFLLIMFGFIFLFPELLRARKDEKGMSSIRFLAFMIVSCFVFVTVLFSWGNGDFASVKVDSTWAYIIGIAMGAKTIQTFAEKLNVTKEQKEVTILNKKFKVLSRDSKNNSSVPADDMSVNFK